MPIILPVAGANICPICAGAGTVAGGDKGAAGGAMFGAGGIGGMDKLGGMAGEGIGGGAICGDGMEGSSIGGVLLDESDPLALFKLLTNSTTFLS